MTLANCSGDLPGDFITGLLEVTGLAGVGNGSRHASRGIDRLDDLPCPPHPGGGGLGALSVSGGYLTGASADAGVSTDGTPDCCRHLGFIRVALIRNITGKEGLGASSDQSILCHCDSPITFSGSEAMSATGSRRCSGLY